jgi:hypothetical protein
LDCETFAEGGAGAGGGVVVDGSGLAIAGVLAGTQRTRGEPWRSGREVVAEGTDHVEEHAVRAPVTVKARTVRQDAS